MSRIIKFRGKTESGELDIIYNGDIVVIGNIHDNPELLNKEDF